MKTSTLLLFFTFIIIGAGEAQSIKEDSLYGDLRHASSPEDSINTLIEISKVQLNYNLNSALSSMQTALALAKKEENERLVAKVKFRYSLYLFMLEKNLESRDMIWEILDYYKEQDNGYHYAILLNRLGKIEMDLAKYEESKEYLLKAKENLLSLKDKGMSALGLNYLWFSDLYLAQAQYEKCIIYAQKAFDLYEEKGNYDFGSAALVNIAEVQLILDDYKESRKIIEAILDRRHEIKNNQFLIKPLNMLGIIEYEQDDFLRSEEIFDEVISIIEVLGNFPDLSITYLYKSKIYAQKNAEDRAIDFALKAKEEAQKSSIKKLEIKANLQLGELFAKVGRKSESEELIKSSFKWANQKEDKEILVHASNLMATCASQIGDFERAFYYKDIENKQSAALLNHQKTKDVAVQQVRYALEKSKKEQEVADKIKELDYKYKLQRASSRQNGLLAGLGLLTIMAGLLIYSNLKRKKSNESLKDKNEELVIAEKILESKNAELEKYIESNIQLQQFAHIASHDLKSPIRTITSFLGLLKRGVYASLDGSQKDYLDLSIASAKDMFDLVNDLLSYSEVNSLKLNLTNIDTHALLEKVIRNLDTNIKEKKAEIQLINIPDSLIGDPLKLRQVFQNLIANALKFVKPNECPRVRVCCEEWPKEWLFKVKDNGIGLDKEFKEKIFEPFVQLNNKKDYSGTGLGLSLCQKIVEKHEGKIWADTNSDGGTTFYFTIKKVSTPKIENQKAETSISQPAIAV